MKYLEDLLNETRTSNLNKLADQSIGNIIQNHSIEDLIRIIYKKFEDWGYKADYTNRMNAISKGDHIDQLSRGIHIETDDYLLMLELKENKKLAIRISRNEDDVYLTSMSLTFNLKENLDDALEKIHDFIEENKAKGKPSTEEKKKKRAELSKKYGTLSKLPKNIANLKDYAIKHYMDLHVALEENGYTLQLVPNYRSMLPIEINSLKTGLLPGLSSIEYSFNMDHIKSIVEQMVKRLETNNHYIKSINANINAVNIEVTTLPGDKREKGANIKIKEKHQRNKSRLLNIEDQYRDLKEMNFQEYKQLLITKIFEGDNE